MQKLNCVYTFPRRRAENVVKYNAHNSSESRGDDASCPPGNIWLIPLPHVATIYLFLLETIFRSEIHHPTQTLK